MTNVTMTEAADRPETSPEDPFHWTPFYEAVATRLLEYQDDRPALATMYRAIWSDAGYKVHQDKYSDGTVGPVQDMCPFTFMWMFNRGNRRARIATNVRERLGIDVPAPTGFAGASVTHFHQACGSSMRETGKTRSNSSGTSSVLVAHGQTI
ncbi:hypothetical protein CRM73_02525 [Kocuria sp. CCUG 69068]|uniref:hypothetical protein n=1 Tax=Kocuria sp. CCUG 69068 TaxID=2043138 RepID=UPI001E44BDA8|nr:hypothetical protein [Kocuria sp. CCUG 69068]